jgi:hypothetical protein
VQDGGLRRAAADPQWIGDAFVAVEVFAFLTGYITRKLLDSQKMSDELEAAVMEVAGCKTLIGLRTDCIERRTTSE